MTRALTADLTYSDDQAAAYDAVCVMLKSAGISLEDDLLMPPKGDKPQVMAVTGKAGSGKTLLLAELYRALEAAGVDIVSGDYESKKRRDKRTLAILAPDQQGGKRAAATRCARDDDPPDPLYSRL